jgi:hypothetical protein
VDLLPPFCTIQRFTTFDVVQAKRMSYCDWHSIDQFLPLASIWMFTQISQCFFIMIVPMSFGASFSFYFCYFSIVKNFNHVAKDASILHFKSCDCDNLTTSLLPNFHPFKTHPPSPQPTYYKRSTIEMERFWHLVCPTWLLFYYLVFLIPL